MKRRLFATALCIAAVIGRTLCAQTLETTVATAKATAPINIAWRTLGGEQFWSDELVYGQWRIQRNEVTGHFRLLDPANVRRAWGTDEQCRAALAELKRSEMLPPLDGRAVITLHGFGRTRNHMAALGEVLEKHGQVTWINVSYASTRRSLDDHAESLARVLDGLEGIDEIDFVCHSLGNLIVRRYLGEASRTQPRWKPDPRIKRMVMLGPPNNGAKLAEVVAELLHDNDLARLIVGPSAWQLARQWDEARKFLATPTFEFGILAGGCGDSRGLNPLLTGDDDLIVTVEETRLAGAADFRVVNCRHGRLMDDPAVQQYVVNFLAHGCFTTADERQPIAALDAAPPPPAAQP
jgi:hypothetical protein